MGFLSLVEYRNTVTQVRGLEERYVSNSPSKEGFDILQFFNSRSVSMASSALSWISEDDFGGQFSPR